MNSVVSFNADLAKFAKILDARIDAVIKNLTLDLFTKFTQRNPVDTGHSRANWRLGINGPDTTVTQGSGLPSIDVSRIKAGVVVYLTNSVDYVQWLEEGTSKQAPSGFVRISVAEVEAKVDSYVQAAVASGYKG